MIRIIYCFLFALTIGETAISQNIPENNKRINDNFEFANYLMGKENYEDAIYLINSSFNNTQLSQLHTDSLNYLKGWAFYNLKQLDSSAYYLGAVSPKSSMFAKGQFFSAYNNIFLEKYSKAKEILTSLTVKDSLLTELKKFELAGIALLEKKTNEYSEINKTFTRSHYQLIPPQEKLDGFYKDQTQFKKKSMAVAGLMSAIIPGSGKMYVGKIGEGVSSLLILSILTGITIENYNRAGIQNYKTILFGSLFTVFYIGNIYGSMASVKIYRNEFYASHHKKILLHIHIPLRTIFN